MYDLIVIGSGPGGYIAAVRAGQLGMKVACIEKYQTYGGTCLNVGCIPSKALLESSDKFEQTHELLSIHGVNVSDVKLDLNKMMERKYGVVKQLTDGIKYLFKKYKVDGITGFGSIVDKTHVKVTADDGSEQVLETKKILIATGSKPASIPGVVIDKDRIVDSTGALTFPEVPKHLIVIGAGVIGLELGSVWRRLGSKVTVLEYMPKILGNSDGEIAKEAKKLFGKQGIEFQLDVKVTGASVKGKTATVTYEDKAGASHAIEADRVLLCVGRKPYTAGLGLENIGLETDKRGFIHIDKNFETSIKGIYAIGDAIAGPMLAHKAEDEGMAVAEVLAGKHGHVNYGVIPGVIYTHPEVANVGATEESLKDQGRAYKVGKFSFMGNGRAKAVFAGDGFVKILADKETDRILGAHIIGPAAGDLIHEICVAMEFGASAQDLALTCHAHPTYSEAVREAALACGDGAIHA